MKKILLITVALLIAFVSQSQTVTVSSLNDSGEGSLRQASIDANSGDTIRFDPNLLTAAVDSISLETDIDFASKGIVIKGLYTETDTLFISGANSSRIFSFNEAGKVVLDSLVLINGKSIGATSLNASAVQYHSGTDTLHVLNSTIRANDGGFAVVYHMSPATTPVASCVILINSTITGNTGGGVTIDFFTENTCTSAINVTNSIISDNTGTGISSKISSQVSTSASNVNITNSIISDNTGTGVYSDCSYSSNSNSPQTSTVTINNSTVSGNMAGGILSITEYSSAMNSSSVVVTNSTFEGNSSNGVGGAICASSTYSSAYVNISNSTFKGNSSDIKGGAVSASTYYGATAVEVSNSTFSENVAPGGGGGVSSEPGQNPTASLTIEGSIFEGSSVFNGNWQSNVPIVSNGFNIFSDAPDGATGTGDQTNATAL